MGSLEETIGVTLHICSPEGTRNTAGEGEKVEGERERETTSKFNMHCFFSKRESSIKQFWIDTFEHTKFNFFSKSNLLY